LPTPQLQTNTANIALGNFKQTALTLAVTKTLTSKVALKMQVERIFNFGDGRPYFRNGDFNNSFEDVDAFTDEVDRTQYIYSVSVDAVF
jgi:hypothetical protein